ESLESEGLVAALGKQADSVRARYQLEVEAALGAEPDVSLDQKEVAYRIAQEALHNVVKHARASRATLCLDRDAEALRLVIQDDGVGFDPGGSFPGHLGLRSMRERAARAGGTLSLKSAPGRGTTIVVRLPG